MDEATLAAQRHHQQELGRLGAILREFRVRSGLTQVALAERLGRTQSFVTKYESGGRRLDLVELDRVCAALDVAIEDCVRRFKAG